MAELSSNKAEQMFCTLLIRNKLSDEQSIAGVIQDRSNWSELTLPDELVQRDIVKQATCEKVRGAVEAKGLSFPMDLGDSPSPSPEPEALAPALETAAEEKNSAPELPPPTTEGSQLIPTQVCSPKGLGQQLLKWLVSARKEGASDLHITVGAPVLVRKHGQLIRLKTKEFTPEEAESILFDVLLPPQAEKCRHEQQLDFSLVLEDDSRFRANIAKERLGWTGSFRIVPDHIPSLEELGLPRTVRTFTEYPTGLVLVTGPMGSGKTTTLAAMVDQINSKRKDHIITVEDPVEFHHKSKSCQVTQRTLGSHTLSFANALKGALRQDPDIIMIGELRDLETISIAITAAETGHLVLGSLHTNSAERTIDRLVTSFPPDQQAQIRVMIADSFRGIICQQLLPKADGSGMAMAYEILVNNTSVRKMIVDNRTFQLESALQTGKKQGMIRMDDSILELLQNNIITEETAKAYMRNPGVLN